jgi:hypothetical protein
MKKRFVRVIAALTVLATAGLSLELIPGGVQLAGAASGSTPVSVGCTGSTTDNAGTVGGAQKTSAGLLALLATLGGPPNLSLPITVNATLPDKVKKGSGPFDASFQLVLALPDSLATQAKTTLGVTKLNIVDANFGMTYDGAETGSLPTTSVASQTIDLAGSASTSVTVAGTVPSDSSGHLNFRLSPFTLGIAINGSVGGGVATINTLTITCGSGAPVGSTTIQVPGAPDTPGTITAGGIIGGDTSLIPIQARTDITPDDGNPIDWSTLSVVNGALGAKVGNGYLAQPTPAAGGVITSTLQVCAPARPVPAVPGTDQVQSLMWPTPVSTSPGAHPLYMTLTFNGKETSAISTSNDFSLGTDAGLLGSFIPPSAATVQAALAALPTIGAGNVKVTSVKGGYNIEFVGAMANTPEPMIAVGKWVTTPFPFSGYGSIQAAIATLTAPAAPPAPGVTTTTNPTATTMTVDQLNAALIKGVAFGGISLATWQAQFPAAFVNSLTSSATSNIDSILATLKQIYPQPPDASGLVAQGVLTIPATTTGPLCSQFDVQTPSVSLAFFQALDRLFKFLDAILHSKTSVLACTFTRVRVKVRVHGHLVTRLVTKKVCPKPAKKVVKKTTKK